MADDDTVHRGVTLTMRRILSLDGGGIRGMFSLQVIARIEQLLREERGRRDLVLADAFDMFAGTSTGAIIATGLAWGMSVGEIVEMYETRGAEMFSRAPWHRRWKSKYSADALAAMFRQVFSEDGRGARPALLGSERLRTLLLVVMRNASTGSPWPLSNNPHAKYNDRNHPDCNLDIPLWTILRASTAAPSYFPPEEIRLSGRHNMFVDGGITSYNNPALLAVLHATLPQYRIAWTASRNDLHVISVGTGGVRARLPKKSAAKINVVDQIGFVIPALVGAAVVEQDMLCRVLGDCVHGAPIDREVGELAEATLFTPGEQKFTYVRYDRSVEAMFEEIGGFSPEKAKLDNLELIPLLQAAGRRYAEENVRLEHLYPRPTEP